MKIVRTAALVVGAVALVATGVGLAAGLSLGAAFTGTTLGFSAALGISAGAAQAVLLGALAIDLSIASQALAPKPSVGGSQTKWKADPYAGIPYVVGRTLTSGNIVYRAGHGGDNKYNTFVTVLSLGPITSIDATFMDKSAVSFDAGGAATGSLAGNVWQRTQLGACPEAAALMPPTIAETGPLGIPMGGTTGSPGWTIAHKLSGLAAVMNTFAFDGKGKSTFTVLPVPAWIIHGVRVYDPRLDSTYPGGSGPCRAYDEDTYVESECPHLHGLTWALGRYQNGVRVAGIGPGNSVPDGPVRNIDIASFVEGANLNDARGWKVGGQVFTRPDTPWNSLKLMLQAGGAKPVLIGGTISCLNRAPRVSLATITRADIIGEAEFSAAQPKRGRPNTVIPQYRSEAHDWEMVSANPVSIAGFVTADGDDRTRELPYPLVQQVAQAAQLAAYDIWDAREPGPGTVALKPWWLNFRIGDCVTFAPEDGWSIKATIGGRGIAAENGTVTYTLSGETDAKHASALAQTGGAPPLVGTNFDQGPIAAPEDDWTLTGETLTGAGGSIAALVLTGEVGTAAADAVIFEYRVHESGIGDEEGWIGASIEAATVTRKEITSVTPGTQYDVGVSYRVHGQTSARAVFGPVTSGFVHPRATVLVADTGGGAGQAALSWRNPEAGGWAYLKVHHGASGVFGSAVAGAAQFVGGLGEVMSTTVTGLAAGTRTFWVVAYAADDTPFDPSAPDSATIT